MPLPCGRERAGRGRLPHGCRWLHNQSGRGEPAAGSGCAPRYCEGLGRAGRGRDGPGQLPWRGARLECGRRLRAATFMASCSGGAAAAAAAKGRSAAASAPRPPVGTRASRSQGAARPGKSRSAGVGREEKGAGQAPSASAGDPRAGAAFPQPRRAGSSGCPLTPPSVRRLPNDPGRGGGRGTAARVGAELRAQDHGSGCEPRGSPGGSRRGWGRRRGAEGPRFVPRPEGAP